MDQIDAWSFFTILDACFDLIMQRFEDVNNRQEKMKSMTLSTLDPTNADLL